MTQYINVGGVWKTVNTQYVNVGGVWRSAGNDGYVKVGGVWKSYKPYGPFEMSYVGYNTVTNATNSANFDIGIDYADRIVFIGVANRYVGTNSVTVGGSAATRIAQLGTYGFIEWWYIVAPPGRGLVNVTSTHTGGYMNTTMVYLLKGGAGLSPTFTTASSAGNNTNTVTAYFSNAVALNDIVLSMSMKLLVLASGAINSNIAPLTQNGQNINVSDTGATWALAGPATSTIAAGSAYVQATGFDSSKPQQILGIKFSKV